MAKGDDREIMIPIIAMATEYRDTAAGLSTNLEYIPRESVGLYQEKNIAPFVVPVDLVNYNGVTSQNLRC